MKLFEVINPFILYIGLLNWIVAYSEDAKQPRDQQSVNINRINSNYVPRYQDANNPLQQQGDRVVQNHPLVDTKPSYPGIDPQKQAFINNNRAPVSISAQSMLLRNDPACAEDVKHFCEDSVKTNFAVMDCLLEKRTINDDVSVSCQHLLWSYKKNITLDGRFDSAAESICRTEFEQITACQNLDPGHKLSCLYENKDNTTSVNCKKFLTRMEIISFTDYRLIYKFADDCNADITKLACGRLHPIEDDSPHTQGKTLECLSNKVQQLTPQCKTQILRLAELQAEDYHLDRPLYYACRDDRERLCSNVASGNGQVLNCLLLHKFDKTMSEECREQLVRRQKLMAEDVRVNRPLFFACQRPIRQHDCMVNGKTAIATQAKALLCLEGLLRDDKALPGECVAAMRQTRASLLEDYQINPGIVANCGDVIMSSCKGLDRGGKTMHCLMAVMKSKQSDTGSPVSDECRRAMEDVIEEADPGEDFEMDPALRTACQTTADALCKNRKPEEVMQCLMSNIDEKLMEDDCKEKLLELQYFLVRDYKLDRSLYKKCKEDAINTCKADDKWHMESTTPKRGLQVFACLYGEFKKRKESNLSPKCKAEIRRVLRERAVSVDLNPRIIGPCMDDLTYYCSDESGKGEEMACLQKNYKDLGPDCKDAVGNFTEDEDEDPQMDRMLMRACGLMFKKFCPVSTGTIAQKEVDPSDAMKCLIEHKNEDDMDGNCRAAIEHHQVISIENYKFSFRFKQACKDDVVKMCRDRTKSKGDVVECLSLAVRDDIINKAEPRVSSQCRQQLSFELLQQGEDFNLNTNLRDACAGDKDRFCRNVPPGGGRVIQCLKAHQKELSQQCIKVLFKREEIEAAVENQGDYELYTNCKRMIKAHCSDANPGSVFSCLVEHKQDDNFEMKCKAEIIRKLRLQAQDVQLNIGLLKSCKLDIPKFCAKELQEEKEDVMKGRVMKCLGITFAQKKLSPECEREMSTIIKESAMDYKQDTSLAKECQKEIERFCLREVQSEDMDDHGQVEECLKGKLKEGRITNPRCFAEVARVLAESKADVHVDPVLYRACAIDLQNLCKEVPRGEGRQMSCLLSALEQKLHLRQECRDTLQLRKTMWELAAEQAPPETLKEVLDQITSSPQRHYLLSVFFIFLGFIFFMGLCCGRATKRITRQLKNR